MTGSFPKLYESGVVYSEERNGYDSFVDAATVVRRGFGDCAHLCAWRVAELKNAGENAQLRVKWGSKRSGRPRPFHVEVRRGDGSTEDPSLALGMD